MGVLGSPEWGATIAEPSGRIVWQSGERMGKWSFSRVLNEASDAVLSIPASPELCDRVEPWIHTLTFWAGTDVAWHGMVIETVAEDGVLTVSAADGGAFWKRRRLPSGRAWDQADASQVMSQLVVDAMSVGDPLHIADHIASEPSRVWVVVNETANTIMVGDLVDDLVDAGLEWTFVGGALLIGPVGARHTTAPLSDRHLGGKVSVKKAGKDVLTDVLVTGDGVWGQRAIADDRIVLQSIEKGDKLVTVQECETRAQAVLDERGVSPISVTVGDTGLRADTPITLDELVPGVRIPVSSTQTGIKVGALLMLEEVNVTQDGVEVSLGQPTTSWEKRAEFPPPPTFDHRSPWDKENQGKNNDAQNKEKAYDADWVKPGIPL